jgi:Asp-tRNA(Asn)/Glu-tRNA(Gln) amidotransferase A subunit family amidase
MLDHAADAVIPTRREFFVTLAAASAAASACALVRAEDPPSGDAVTTPIAPATTDAITENTIAEAEKLAGIRFTPTERAQMLRSVGEHVATFKSRAAFGALDNQLAPALVFRVMLPGETRGASVDAKRAPFTRKPTAPPSNATELDELIDFATVEQLGEWMSAGSITSRRLVERSLARLKKANATLFNVITLVEAPALLEADARDAEFRAGKSRGPLHGIPYGLKDLFDTANIATTWGAEPWRDRVPTSDAAIVTRLREAGAVLVAKTAVGALAYGDIWFGGTCKNPWNIAQGSSGSSAGSAASVAAGCVPFAIGTETLGSIVSPCTRCGATGLRPTFGRVPRDGAMALCWSWDKVGAITRSVIDAGLVLEVLNGATVADASSVSVAFAAPRLPHAKGVRLAYDPAWFAREPNKGADVLDAARACGAILIEKKIAPPADPGILVTSLMCEAAAAFEHMTRTSTDDLLSWQADEAWPNSFRQTWFIPAIELVQTERVRRVFMQWMREVLSDCDALILPPFAGGMLVITNATGHPTLCMRAGFEKRNEPRSITLIGHPFDEATLLEVGAALEASLAVADKRPEMPWM